MGQTLSHGVYLPNEGERNCYAGLASNWQILNTAVGAIAEKAPLVHTHTVSQITDFPAYGNAAGTICEGNDSRLSDARTPVAHTHTKSDITDLLNSNFIPSANNSYDLGSSSYQWNNLYVKNYYYNGVAWGLDKSNTWTTTNIFTGTAQPIFLRGSSNDIYNVSPQSLVQSQISFVDKNNTKMSSIVFQHRTEATETHRLCLRQQKVTSDGYYSVALSNLGNFYPENTNAITLGTSSNKWATLNGVNPGALSLPDYNNYLDVTSNIPVASLDGTQIDLNTYLADKTGWLSIVIADTAGNYITVTQGRAGGSTVFNNSRTFHTGAQSNGYISAFFPIIAGMSKFAFIKASSLIQMRFYYCLGNV